MLRRKRWKRGDRGEGWGLGGVDGEKGPLIKRLKEEHFRLKQSVLRSEAGARLPSAVGRAAEGPKGRSSKN